LFFIEAQWVSHNQWSCAGNGIGYFLWNEWNNLALSSVIFAILLIGIVGMLLDIAFSKLQKVVSYAD
jgi:nitrate/nitrite transport system permease protein